MYETQLTCLFKINAPFNDILWKSYVGFLYNIYIYIYILTQACLRNLIRSKRPTLMFLSPTNKAHFTEVSVSPFQVKKPNYDDFEDSDNQANTLNEFAKK
jgi:hypothetical protein